MNKGDIIAIDIINVILVDFLEFIGQVLTEGQKKQVAYLILKTYPNYRPEQVRLCFERIKSGRYGTIYGQVNGMVIMEFFLKFDIEIDEEIKVIRSQESDKYKKDFSFSIKAPETDDEKKAEAFRLMKEDLAKIGKEKDLKSVKNGYMPNSNFKSICEGTQGINGDLLQLWLKEFDDLYRLTGNVRHKIKSVKIDGMSFRLLEFLEYKQEQFNRT